MIVLVTIGELRLELMKTSHRGDAQHQRFCLMRAAFVELILPPGPTFKPVGGSTEVRRNRSLEQGNRGG